jgi:hypothetical protein
MREDILVKIKLYILMTVTLLVSCHNNIFDPLNDRVVSVTGITLDSGTSSIPLWETHQIIPTITPGDATNTTIAWTTTNASIASVSSNGIVSGETIGSATITATTEDGSFFDTCVITVTTATPPSRIVLGDYQAGGYIYISIDGGATWTQKGSAQVWSAVASTADGSKLVAAVDGVPGDIYTSSDGGNSWTANSVDLSNNHSWSSVAISDNGNILFATDYRIADALHSPPTTGYIYSSTDGGTTWSSMTAPGIQYWNQIVVSTDGAQAMAVVGGISLPYSFMYNGSWSTSANIDGGAGHQFVSAAAASGLNRFIVGAASGDYIYTSLDAGGSWTKQTTPGTGYWFAVASSSEGRRFIAADNNNFSLPGGYIWTSSDGGATWVQRTSAGQRVWRSLASTPNGAYIVAGVNGGHVFTSNDGGATWTDRTVGSGSIAAKSIAVIK